MFVCNSDTYEVKRIHTQKVTFLMLQSSFLCSTITNSQENGVCPYKLRNGSKWLLAYKILMPIGFSTYCKVIDGLQDWLKTTEIYAYECIIKTSRYYSVRIWFQKMFKTVVIDFVYTNCQIHDSVDFLRRDLELFSLRFLSIYATTPLC